MVPHQFVCNVCRNKGRECFYCGLTKPESQFPAARWERVSSRRICIECGMQRQCSFCNRRADQRHFSHTEWNKNDSKRLCTDCVPHRCSKLKKAKRREAYSAEQWKRGDGQGLCMECDKRRCMKCFREKGCGAFASAMWCLPPGSKDFFCKFCCKSGREIGHWTCFAADCRNKFPKEEFQLAQLRFAKQQLRMAKHRVCDSCMTARKRTEEEIAASNVRSVVKYRKIQ